MLVIALFVLSSSLALVSTNRFSAEIKGPFTDHFQVWLANHGNFYNYLLANIAKYGSTGSFGGCRDENHVIHRTPVIFIHGNSDSALASGDFSTGWNAQLDYFSEHGGYTSAELYGLTYGDRNVSNSATRDVNCDELFGHRRLLEAVIQYTGSKHVSIIAHSMGVTIARKIIQGGLVESLSGSCDLGLPLRHQIDTFIALAGANYGMCMCKSLEQYPACNHNSGFYPGECMDNGIAGEEACASESNSQCAQYLTSYSKLLDDLNAKPKDAHYVVSCWSDSDEILGGGNWVWGRRTSLVPYSDTHKIFKGLNHMEVKTDTVSWQHKMVHRTSRKARSHRHTSSRRYL